MNIHVASSWRNAQQPEVVKGLRSAGFDVYDFKNPRPGDRGFHWSEIEDRWQQWTPSEFRRALSHPIAERGFASDWDAMVAADACVLVMPSGRSAHIEAGYFVGAKKPLVILLAPGEPELMYKMTPHICLTIPEVIIALEDALNRRDWDPPQCRVMGCRNPSECELYASAEWHPICAVHATNACAPRRPLNHPA